jgi:hypothetical protein
MKLDLLALGLVLAAVVVDGAAAAQAATAEDDAPNQFGFGARLGFNIKARFSNLGGYTSGASPGPASGGGLDRTYDDGFVRVDGSGNRGGQTWNWGYQSAAQIPGNDTVVMHATAAPANLTSSAQSDPPWGGELVYKRRLAQQSWGAWGVEAAVGNGDLNIRDSQALTGNAAVTTDSYPLGGLIPPQAPYAGSLAGPGILIGDSPTRTVATLAAGQAVSGWRALEGSLYNFRLGPYLTWPIGDRLSLQLGAGLGVGVVSGEFSFAETLAASGTVLATRTGSSDRTDTLWGGYAGAQFACRLGKHVEAFVGAQFQHLQDFKIRAGAREAELGLGETVFLTAGAQIRF